MANEKDDIEQKIEQLHASRQEGTFFMSTGVRLTGVILSYTPTSILLSSNEFEGGCAVSRAFVISVCERSKNMERKPTVRKN